MSAKISAAWMIITSEFFSFNVWEWFLHSSVLEWTESHLSKINLLRGVILLNPIVLVPWGRFPLCHTPIRPISAFRDQILILIVGCVTTWSWGSHQYYCQKSQNMVWNIIICLEQSPKFRKYQNGDPNKWLEKHENQNINVRQSGKMTFWTWKTYRIGFNCPWYKNKSGKNWSMGWHQTKTHQNSQIMTQALFVDRQTYLNHFHSVRKPSNSSKFQSC